MKRIVAAIVLAIVFFALTTTPSPAEDRPQWGEKNSRNMISSEKNLSETFEPGTRNAKTGEIDLPDDSGVKWVAKLGGQTCGTPVVAGGKVFVGTNNDAPRDRRIKGDRGVLMCFDEKTGEFLWQLVIPKLLKVKWADWAHIGLTSPPSVEGDRAYIVSNNCKVMCLDANGMADGNDGPYKDEARQMALDGQDPIEPGEKDGDIIWVYDMNAELNVEPHNGANCSVLIDGDLLYVCTSNGVEWTHKYVVHPEAPSMIVLDKKTGKLVARDDFGIGADITHGQWSSPAAGKVGDRQLGFFGAGDGCLYAFEMLDPKQTAGDKLALLKNVWKFNGEPAAQTKDRVPRDHQHDSVSYQVTANPVFYKDRIYLAFTQEPFHRMKKGWLLCLDATKNGDITRSGIVWAYKDISSCIATVSIADGLLYVVDFDGDVHCLDAETGKPYWVHRIGGDVWGSTMVADGKVYVGTKRNMFWVLAAGREPKVLSQIRMRDGIQCTPTPANGVLYIATNKHLYAVGK